MINGRLDMTEIVEKKREADNILRLRVSKVRF